MSRKPSTLPQKLQEMKKSPRMACGCGQPRSHLIRVLNEKSVGYDGNSVLSSVVGDSQISLI